MAALLLALASQAAAAAGSLCASDEVVAFNCRLTERTVSLCMQAGSGEQTGALIFRLGRQGRLQREFVASPGNGQHFSATVAPARPGAMVRQVWFDQHATRTLLTECVGGSCKQAAGYALLRGSRVIVSRACQRTRDDAAWFARQLITFGADADSSVSMSPLLQIEDLDNPIEAIYAPQGP